MSSTVTTPIAARLPNDLADRIRREAETTGDTVSVVAARYIKQAITDNPEASE